MENLREGVASSHQTARRSFYCVAQTSCVDYSDMRGCSVADEARGPRDSWPVPCSSTVEAFLTNMISSRLLHRRRRDHCSYRVDNVLSGCPKEYARWRGRSAACRQLAFVGFLLPSLLVAWDRDTQENCASYLKINQEYIDKLLILYFSTEILWPRRPRLCWYSLMQISSSLVCSKYAWSADYLDAENSYCIRWKINMYR